MNEQYYPKEIEIVSSYINQFNYSDKYVSKKELESLLKKDIPLSVEELEKVLINSRKILKMTDFFKNLKVSAKIELEKKHLYLFYYSLMSFFESGIEENKLKILENFLREVMKNRRLEQNDFNLFERNFYTFLKDDSLKNKGFERYLYEKLKMYFKDNEKEIYRFCKEQYILINSFSLKTLLFRYLKENQNNEKIINLKSLEIIKKVIK
ncbi:hypothetical protein RN87_03650 [Fusobacterium hwasookii ChDC F174]|uniref:Uncharacterized protein n=1 Tax=Fusobacterium hwasookii ChDC F174 TaxID=1307442 RepID=A0A0S2ZL17_9FUSO|nr:hypothetical protein [Fusobacterium hwasookii]ALQ39650.1 hypothetical protein RN87_03650 [Fusobacterium hwasookii ChDC F174]